MAASKPATTRRRRAPAPPVFQPAAAEPAPSVDDDMPHPQRIAPVPVDQIERDERVNTRPVDEAWVARTAKVFDAEALGVLAVSLRKNGTIIVVDGQNRVALLREVGWGNRMVACRIYEGLSLAEEAGLFVLLNSGRAPNAMSKFLARVTGGDPKILEIVRVVENNGFRIDRADDDDVIMGVSTIEGIWDRDKRRNKGQAPQVLGKTLRTIVEAWQFQPGATHQAVIDGISKMYLVHGPAINQEDLIARLAAYDGGAEQLRKKAVGLQSALGKSVGNAVAFMVTELYNKNRQSRRLPQKFG